MNNGKEEAAKDREVLYRKHETALTARASMLRNEDCISRGGREAGVC